MIVRKPYAFLIKNFRLIHGLIFIMLIYLFIKSINIYTFFSDYASKHFFINTVTLTSDHVSSLMLIIPIIVLLLVSIIYYLLSIKKKNRNVYLFMGIYFIILFIYYIYMMNVFTNLQSNFLNTETVRVLRDVSLIILLPQIFFIFLVLVRTLGFNLKQFEFKKDLEDLQIDTTDYEEVEITLGKNNYKYIRSFKKALREIGYFLQENKFFVTIILSIFVFSLSLFIYINIKVTHVKYLTNQTIYANTMWYTVTDAYVSSKDTSGNIIAESKKYIIVRVKIDNKTNKKYDLSKEVFRLQVGKDSILPKYNLNKEFIDFGNIYSPMTIDVGEIKIVNVIFEIDEKEKTKEYLFKINNLENLKAADTQYKEIIVIPKDVDKIDSYKEYNILDSIEFDNKKYGNSKLTINDFEISNNFKELYTYCLNKNCYDKIYSVRPSNTKKTIIKINYKLEIDKESILNNILKESSMFFEYFININYKYLTQKYKIKPTVIKTDYKNDEVIYLEVPSEIKDADNISISFSMRNKKITIILK